MNHVGILAYGSLIQEPGEELERVTVHRIPDVQTPFAVEFARSSRSRDGGPTLIPVNDGGAGVAGVVLVLDDAVGKEAAESMLWRRETNRVGAYETPPEITQNTVVVEQLRQFAGIDLVLYTRIGANIEDRRPERLAELAVRSARGSSGAKRRDGISYLIRAKAAGITTPLLPAYEGAILSLCGVTSLEEAWRVAQAQL
jgi:cation transport regulator ChaC